MFFHFMRFLAYLPLLLLYPCKIVGRKNLKKGKAILTPNHISNVDAILILANTYEKKYVLAKKEIFKNKLLGAIFKGIGAIKIDRDAADISAIKKSLSVLKKGKKLIIFPEGTRNKSDIKNLGDMKSGTAMIAIKSRSPIIPVWISRKPKIFRRTVIKFGEPYELNEFYNQKLSDEVLNSATEVIKNKILELS